MTRSGLWRAPVAGLVLLVASCTRGFGGSAEGTETDVDATVTSGGGHVTGGATSGTPAAAGGGGSGGHAEGGSGGTRDATGAGGLECGESGWGAECPASTFCDGDDCVADETCLERAAEVVAWLAAPEPDTTGPLTGSTCLEYVDPCAPHGCGDNGGGYPPESTFKGPTGCVCHHENGADFVLGGPDPCCDVHGRGPGQCAVLASAFTGCDPADATSCDAACEAAEASVASDRAATFDVAVRQASCLRPDRFIGEGCRIVVRVDGSCWVTGWGHVSVAAGAPQRTMVGPFDCALGDDAMIAAAYPEDECIARPAGEWEGMRVCPPYQVYCEHAGQCGLAMACIDGGCGPCTSDEQCAPGEGCVLDHCVLSENISCRTRSECGANEMCILSGYTDGEPRGNGDMRAFCN